MQHKRRPKYCMSEAQGTKVSSLNRVWEGWATLGNQNFCSLLWAFKWSLHLVKKIGRIWESFWNFMC
jgi:hypothetical protein